MTELSWENLRVFSHLSHPSKSQLTGLGSARNLGLIAFGCLGTIDFDPVLFC